MDFVLVLMQDLQRCLTTLAKINDMVITPDVIKKSPAIIQTIKKVLIILRVEYRTLVCLPPVNYILLSTCICKEELTKCTKIKKGFL